jgi:hypothetical protein
MLRRGGYKQAVITRAGKRRLRLQIEVFLTANVQLLIDTVLGLLESVGNLLITPTPGRCHKALGRQGLIDM